MQCCSPAERSFKLLLRAVRVSLSLSHSPTLSLSLSHANKRTLLIFKLCRNCSANYQSFATWPSDALELWPNICFLTLKSARAGHALCYGEFYATSLANSLPKLTSNGKIANSCFFSYGAGRGRNKKWGSKEKSRNISTHKTFMRRTISGLASERAELSQGRGGRAGP